VDLRPASVLCVYIRAAAQIYISLFAVWYPWSTTAHIQPGDATVTVSNPNNDPPLQINLPPATLPLLPSTMFARTGYRVCSQRLKRPFLGQINLDNPSALTSLQRSCILSRVQSLPKTFPLRQLSTTPAPITPASSQLAPLVTNTWVDRIPVKLRPYALLARVDKPIGTMLLLWPCSMYGFYFLSSNQHYYLQLGRSLWHHI
jgi:hypothetical protein